MSVRETNSDKHVSYKVNRRANKWFVTDRHGQSVIHGEMRWWTDFGFSENAGWVAASIRNGLIDSVRRKMTSDGIEEIDPYALAGVSREKESGGNDESFSK